jgi:uncharacterized membrane protein
MARNCKNLMNHGPKLSALTSGPEGDRIGTLRWFIVVLLILAFGVWLRADSLAAEGLWLDEIYSASLSNLSLLGTVVADLHFDVHPPLYYLQLNLWGRLGHGDEWLRLNSVFWSAATLLAVLLAVTRRFGSRSGLLAMAVCAVLGSEIYYAHELRMYSLYAFLCVACWGAADRLRVDYRLGKAIPLIVLLVLLTSIHSASLIAASAVILYAFPTAASATLERRALKRNLATWLTVGLVTGLAALPWVLFASHRAIGHALMPSWHALIQTTSGWILGYGGQPLPNGASAATAWLLLLALLLASMVQPGVLRIVGCFIVWPLAFGGLLSVLVEPIWLDRTFAFCGPFVTIALAAGFNGALDRVGASKSEWSRQAIVSMAILAVVAAGLFDHRQNATLSKPDGYREAGNYVTNRIAANDIVYVPSSADFWGMSRYLIGPEWGSILEIQDPLEGNKVDDLLQSHLHLSEVRMKALHIVPLTRELDGFKVPVFTGHWPLPIDPAGRTVWFARLFDQPLDIPSCTPIGQRMTFGRLYLYRLNCGAS